MGEIIDKKWFAGLVGILLSLLLLLSAHPAASQAQAQPTTGARVVIPIYIEIALANMSAAGYIDFCEVEPATLEAPANCGGHPLWINITENTNTDVNLTTNVTAVLTYGSDWIGADNHTYDNDSSHVCYQNMSTAEMVNDTPKGTCNFYWWEWQDRDPIAGANVTVYMYNWLNIPIGQAYGTYTGTVMVKGWPSAL